MPKKLSVGELFPANSLKNIHGVELRIPDPSARATHVQFRRFAGCPICNLHLRSFVQRHGEIKDAGIREIVLFHSTDDALRPYQGEFPFDVVGDPERVLYKKAGVEASPLALLNPRAWPAIVKGNLAKKKPKGGTDGSAFGLPADFLIGPDGKILEAHYGTHAYDQWSVDQLLAKVRGSGAEAA